MSSSWGETPVDVYFDRDIVITFGGPEAEDVLFEGPQSDRVTRAAIHESGHVVVAWRFGRGISAVSVREDGSGLATFTPLGVSTESVEAMRSRGEMTAIDSPETPARRSLSDGRRAVLVGKMLRADRKSRRALLRCRRYEARLLVNQNARLIRAVAAELLKAGRLSGVEIEQIITKTMDAAREKRLRELGLLK